LYNRARNRINLIKSSLLTIMEILFLINALDSVKKVIFPSAFHDFALFYSRTVLFSATVDATLIADDFSINIGARKSMVEVAQDESRMRCARTCEQFR